MALKVISNKKFGRIRRGRCQYIRDFRHGYGDVIKCGKRLFIERSSGGVREITGKEALDVAHAWRKRSRGR